MKGQSDTRKRLAHLLDEVAVREGVQRTSVEGVEVARVSTSVPRAPVLATRLLRVGSLLATASRSSVRRRGDEVSDSVKRLGGTYTVFTALPNV